MRHFLSQLEYPSKDPDVVTAPDPNIVLHANHMVQNANLILATSVHPKTRKS
jgi:polyphosphate kinase